MISGHNKYTDLVRQVGYSRIVVVLDDLPEMIWQADSHAIRTIIRDQPYNRHIEWPCRAMDLKQAQTQVMEELSIWERLHG